MQVEILRRTQFGDPILRQVAREVPVSEIDSPRIRSLVGNMRHTLIERKLGVALAAPQVGESVALVVVAVRPLLHRHQVGSFDMVLINPKITEYIGRRRSQWEGCISSGRGGQADLFAKVPRYPKVKVRYRDEKGRQHHTEFFGLRAQIVQHEIDHLNGILFVDHVKDTRTFMTYREYMKMVRKSLKSQRPPAAK